MDKKANTLTGAERPGEVTTEDQQTVRNLLDQFAGIEYTAHAEGHKSSEGDGRTAADIEAELAALAQEAE